MSLGSETITLSVEQLPSHNHSISHTHTYTPSGTVASHNHYMKHDHPFSGTTTNGLTARTRFSMQGAARSVMGNAGAEGYAQVVDKGAVDAGSSGDHNYTNTLQLNLSHGHSFSGNSGWSNTGNGASEMAYTHSSQPSFTGTQANISHNGNSGNSGSGSAINIMPPYVVKYCWERTAL